MTSLKIAAFCIVGVGILVMAVSSSAQDTTANASFKTDVMPIIKKYCLPCHSEDNYNPSELSLDSYQLIMEGGKHGPPVVPGNPDKSLLLLKVNGSAPFGDPMPLGRRQNNGQIQQKHLTAEELTSLRNWIAHGAKQE